MSQESSHIRRESRRLINIRDIGNSSKNKINKGELSEIVNTEELSLSRKY